MDREIEAIPFRSFMRDGRLIYSKVTGDMRDLPLGDAEGVLVHEYRKPSGHSFRIARFG
jgi:hypothetical protein